MADIIYPKNDLPSIYKSEGSKYSELSVTDLSTIAGGSFTSTTSGTTYTYTNGQDLYNQLAVVLDDYSITAIEWNTVRSFILGQGMPVSNGIKQTLVRVDGKLSEVRLFQSNGTTLMARTVLNRVNNALDSVDTIVYDTNGTSVLCQFKDTLVRVGGQLQDVTRTVQVI